MSEMMKETFKEDKAVKTILRYRYQNTLAVEKAIVLSLPWLHGRVSNKSLPS